MDSYLDIAASVLRVERRPLSPRAILATAYRTGIVPHHLHGRTQHKTLQARMSEDIIARREHSLFFRTRPGKFFLREFLADMTIPEEFRRPFPSRRRFRELLRGPSLAFDTRALTRIGDYNSPIDPRSVYGLLNTESCRYQDPRARSEGTALVRAFVCVYRDRSVLTYRLGRYREDRDTFLSRRSLGFAALVSMDERTLFTLNDFGILDAGVRAAKIDLDVPEVPGGAPIDASLACFIWACTLGTNDLLAVIRFRCPDWFEPVKRRLALNDLRWVDLSTPINNIDDFDPWSQAVLLSKFDPSRDEHVNATQ